MGRLAETADTRRYIEERGNPSGFPLLVFHGEPGLDHTCFGDYLDPLTEGSRYRPVLADERACGRSDRTAPRQTWTLERMAQDVSDMAASLGVISGYATLGHSYGAFLVLQHAVDHPVEQVRTRSAAPGSRQGSMPASRSPGSCKISTWSPRSLRVALGSVADPD